MKKLRRKFMQNFDSFLGFNEFVVKSIILRETT